MVAGIPDAVFIQMGGYVFLVVLMFFMLNRAMQGFVTAWFKVRRQRGSLVLVRVRTVTNDYFISGRVEEGWLIYRPRKKKKSEEKRIVIPDKGIYRSFALACIDVDDSKDCVFVRDGTGVPGYDAEKNNSLHLRALYGPSLLDDKTKIIIVILVVVLIVVIISAVMSYRNGQNVLAEINALKTVSQAASNGISPTTGGV